MVFHKVVSFFAAEILKVPKISLLAIGREAKKASQEVIHQRRSKSQGSKEPEMGKLQIWGT